MEGAEMDVKERERLRRRQGRSHLVDTQEEQQVERENVEFRWGDAELDGAHCGRQRVEDAGKDPGGGGARLDRRTKEGPCILPLRGLWR